MPRVGPRLAGRALCVWFSLRSPFSLANNYCEWRTASPDSIMHLALEYLFCTERSGRQGLLPKPISLSLTMTACL